MALVVCFVMAIGATPLEPFRARLREGLVAALGEALGHVQPDEPGGGGGGAAGGVKGQ